MITMIIADDELFIRQGLMSIPWDELGIRVAGVASNGVEALSMVKAEHPQILLTDIKMPGMDGLKLIEAVKNEVPDIKAILLSGYQDFSYAHSAIRLGAMGYVLKPSDPDEIINTVLKAKKQIEERIAANYEKEKMLKIVDRAMPAVLSSFLMDLLFGRISDQSAIDMKCSEFNCCFKNYVVMLVEIRVENGSISAEEFNKIYDEIHNTASGYSESIMLSINPTSLCLINEIIDQRVDQKANQEVDQEASHKANQEVNQEANQEVNQEVNQETKQEANKEKMLALAMEIRNNIKSNFGIYVSVGISRCFNSAAEMAVALNQAVNCLKMKFSLGKGAIIHIEDLKDSLQHQYFETLKMTDDILENIKNGNYRLVEKLTRELLYRLSREQKADEQILKTVCFDILVSSYRVLKEDKDIEKLAINEHLLLSGLSACKDVEELEEYVINKLMNIVDSVCAEIPSAKSKVITEIMDYIEKLYMEEISLITLSEHIHMNHIYISRLIKRETGETFLDILTRKRMKRACELLTGSDSKTYEIAYKVGIKDSGYFSQVFKKYYGKTPSEYREKISAWPRNSVEEKQ